MADLVGVRVTPRGFQAYCTRDGEEFSLGFFDDAEMAAQAHDCGAIKVALEEGASLQQVQLNEPLTEEWTEEILEGLKAQPWEEVLTLISAGPLAEPPPSQPSAELAHARPSVSPGSVATPTPPGSAQVCQPHWSVV
jgi:hypothetical protein